MIAHKMKRQMEHPFCCPNATGVVELFCTALPAAGLGWIGFRKGTTALTALNNYYL
jgi:hypothetical protein